MSTAILDEPTTRRPDGYPFHIGYRPVVGIDADGTPTHTEEPLTEEDFLHPQEEDQFLNAGLHRMMMTWLCTAIEYARRGRAELGLFANHRIDWQVPGVLPHGPDLAVFDRYPANWSHREQTLRVADAGVSALLVLELTSDATRHVDLEAKFDEYQRVGVPYYLVLDLAAPNDVPVLLAFERDGTDYQEMTEDPTLGFWIPGVGLWFRYQNERLMIADADGADIPTPTEAGLMIDGLSDEVERVLAVADAEKQRADAAAVEARSEKERADAEKERADAEKERAEELARELADLKARLASNG